MNDFAPLPVRANVVPDLGDDNRAVYSANRRPNIRRHRSEGIYVEFEQLANGNRAPVALGFEHRTDEAAELAVTPMISAGEMRALAVEV